MVAGSSIVSVSSLAAAGYREHLREVAPLLTPRPCRRVSTGALGHPDDLAGTGYQLSKEAIILYTMRSATPLGARGIRINCTGPGVTETPILDQLRTAYGQGFLDDIPKPLGRVSEPAEQAAVLLFLNSQAASYISGQVVWVDGGNVGAAIARELEEGRAPWPSLTDFRRVARDVSNWGRWGDDDELGTLNFITADKVAQAASLVRHGKVFPLGVDFGASGPQGAFEFRHNPVHVMTVDGGDVNTLAQVRSRPGRVTRWPSS